MKLAYARVSKSDGSQNLDLQIDALTKDGVEIQNIYQEKISGNKAERPILNKCLKSLKEGDTLIVYKLDRLGRSLRHLVNIVQDLTDKKIGFKVLAGKGANIDTTTPNGKLIFGIFASIAEFERELIVERTKAGLEAARKRGRIGGRKFKMTKERVIIAQNFMQNRNKHQDKNNIDDLCKELGGITKQTLYRYVSPDGKLRNYGKKFVNHNN